jgi:transposase
MEAARPRPYSTDLRGRVLRACARGEGTRAQIARRFWIGESTVYHWLRQEREDDRRRPKPHAGGRSRVINAKGDGVLRDLVAADSDGTLAEYAAAFEARTGHRVSRPMVCKALNRLGLRRKKRRFGPANRIGRTWPRSARPTGANSPRSIPPR